VSAEKAARRRARREQTARSHVEPLLQPGEEILAIVWTNTSPVDRSFSKTGVLPSLFSIRFYLLAVTTWRLFAVRVTTWDRPVGVEFVLERSAIEHLRVTGFPSAKVRFESAGARYCFLMRRSEYNDRFPYAFAGTAYGPSRT
jgi:hypothetical protein